MTVIPQTAALETALQQAFVHHRAGRLSEAERLYRGILQTRPDHPGITNNLGLVLKDQGRLEEAAATFQRLLALKPDDALAHCNLGNVFGLQGRPDQAAACYRRALPILLHRLGPTHPITDACRRNIAHLSGDVDDPGQHLRSCPSTVQVGN